MDKKTVSLKSTCLNVEFEVKNKDPESLDLSINTPDSLTVELVDVEANPKEFPEMVWLKYTTKYGPVTIVTSIWELRKIYEVAIEAVTPISQT